MRASLAERTQRSAPRPAAGWRGPDRRCLRCLLLVMCTYPIAKESLTLYLARSEGDERYFCL